MTAAGLIAAAACGVLIGLSGSLVPPVRRLPLPLAMAVAVTAAVFGFVGARTVTPTDSPFGLADVAASFLFAAIGLTVAAFRLRPASGDSRPPDDRT